MAGTREVDFRKPVSQKRPTGVRIPDPELVQIDRQEFVGPRPHRERIPRAPFKARGGAVWCREDTGLTSGSTS